MTSLDQEWRRKGATLSDKTACKEFGLTRDEIVEAIGVGKLHYRVSSMHGSPWLRPLRREVEELVKVRHGGAYLEQRQLNVELARIDSELRRLRSQLTMMEERRAQLASRLARGAPAAG